MNFVIFGGGGHAHSIVDVILRAGHRVAAVVAPVSAVSVAQVTLTSEEDGIDFARQDAYPVLVAIGDNERRLDLARRLVGAGLDLVSFVASSATVAADAELGPGTVALEHAHVGPRSRLGTAVVVNTSAIVEHDGELDDGSHIAPGAVLGGGVSAGAGALVGAGATVLRGTRVGAWTVVGAGAVVIRTVPDRSVVVGVPARPVTGAGPGDVLDGSTSIGGPPASPHDRQT